MIANDWEKIEDIFHTAVGLPFAERKPFLRRECGGNGDLLSEIESLIESFEDNSQFLKQPVFEFGLGALNQSIQKDLSGSKMGFYELKEKIGVGGMGEVYKAFDTHLNRFVALKFLSESLKNETSAKRQLIKEAQAAAALDHPNICTVHGFEQTDEHYFIVMQYVEGITLGEKIAGEKIGVEEFKSLTRQILSAVALAHSHGVIHRDLKPGNIMLTNDGLIKVLDFGLAKIIAPKQFGGLKSNSDTNLFSTKGLIMGTVSYMSPEQLRGEKLDYRSDIFSVGIILYELLTGQKPFQRASQAETIAAILNENQPPIRNFAPDFPENLNNFVEKCLQKNKNERFESVAEMLVEIDAPGESSNLTNSRTGNAFILKFAFAVAVLLGIFGFIYFYNATPPRRTLAVLPFSFDNPQPEEEYLSDALTQSLIEKLSNLSDVKITNNFAVARFKGKLDAPETTGKMLNVDAVFAGMIVKRTGGIVLETKLVRTSDGFVIADENFPVDTNDLIGLQETISAYIIDKIKSNLTDDDRAELAKNDTENEEAKRLYFLGRYYLNRRADGDEKNAVRSFQTAKELDPYFAKAWTGLADAYLAQSSPGVEDSISPKESVKLARDAIKQALQIDNNFSEAYNSLGLINSRYDWNWADGESSFRTAIKLNPEFIPARIGLIGVLNALGRFDESLEEARKIKEIAPTSSVGDIEIAKIYYMKRDFLQMENTINTILSQNPGNDRIYYIQTYLFLNTNRYNEAIDFLEKKYKSEKPADKIFVAGPLGFAYAKVSRRNDALKVIETLDKLNKTQYVAPQEKSFVYIGLGDFDKVFEHLNESCNERYYSLAFWSIDPVVDEIKSDPRFNKIKECVNL